MSEQSMAKGFALLSISGIIVKIFSLLYIPFLVSILGDNGYGIYSAAYQTFVLLYAVANTGIPVAISKHVSEFIALGEYKDAIRAFKVSRSILIVLGVFTSVLLFLLSNFTANFSEFPQSAMAVAALAPTLLFSCLNSAYRGYYQGRGNMIPTSVSQIIEQVANVVFTLLFSFLLLNKGVEYACMGGTLGTSLAAIICTFYLIIYHSRHKKIVVKKGTLHTPARPRSFNFLAKLILSSGIPATLCIFLQYSGNWIDMKIVKNRLMAGGIVENEATTLFGILTKYVQLMGAPLAITGALTSAVIPAIAAAVVTKNKDNLQNKSNFAFRMTFIVTIPSAFGLSVLSYFIYWLLGWDNGYDLMLYGAYCLIFLGVLQIQTSILQGAGYLYTATFHVVLGIIGGIFTDFILIPMPEFGIKGAIVGSLVRYIIPIALNLLTLSNKLNIHQNLLSLTAKPIFSSIIMSVVAYFSYYGITSIVHPFVLNATLINTIALLASILIAAIVYMIAMLATKGIKKEDLEVLPHKISRFILPFVKA